jgi:hypothetical protein
MIKYLIIDSEYIEKSFKYFKIKFLSLNLFSFKKIEIDNSKYACKNPFILFQ